VMQLSWVVALSLGTLQAVVLIVGISQSSYIFVSKGIVSIAAKGVSVAGFIIEDISSSTTISNITLSDGC